MLVENAGRLLSKDELHEAVWGNIAVTDDSITHCISDIRKALGDSERTIVQTVARRGYRFSLPVTTVPDGDPDAGIARTHARWPLAVLAAAIFAVGFWAYLAPPGVPPNSVAVFPFAPDPGSRVPGASPALGESFSNELGLLLARIDGIRTVSRRSSSTVSRAEADVKSKARMLNVAFIVEGYFQVQEDRISIAVELIDGQTGLVEWAEAYEINEAELTQAQRSIAEAIVDIVMPGADTSDAVASLPSSPAMRLIFHADSLEQQVREKPEVDFDLLLEAIRYYNAATEVDPQSALAHSRLAAALLYLGDADSAKSSIDRALSLDPGLAEAQTTYGKYLVSIGSRQAGDVIERALEIDPHNADALSLYAYWLWLGGNAVGPAEYYRLALESDRLSLSRYADLGNFLGVQARTSEVRELIAEIKELFKSPEAYEVIARMHEFLGEADHAIAWTLRARDRDPDNPAYTWKLAELYATIGDQETALSLDRGIGTLFFVRDYDAMIEKGEDLVLDFPGDMMARYLLAFAYNATGDYQGARSQLEAADIPGIYLQVPSAVQIEATMTYMNALYALGEYDELQPLLDHWQNRKKIMNYDWWSNTIYACNYAMLGDSQKAVRFVVRISGSTRIPWYPLLLDSPCFRELDGNKEFQALLDDIFTQRRRLRERLPETLAEYGVSL